MVTFFFKGISAVDFIKKESKWMNIRRANNNDTEGVLNLLSQVLEVHAAIRPDIFISGTTKYTNEELQNIFKDDLRPIYVAVNDADEVLGYAFCVIKKYVPSNNIVPFDSIYIDDLCVDEKARGQHIATKLFEHVKEEARKMGCYEITLNVWEGNDNARSFYDNMGMCIKSTTMEYIL